MSDLFLRRASAGAKSENPLSRSSSSGKLVEDKPLGKENTANFHTDVVTSAFSQDVKGLAEDPCDDVALMPVV